MNDPQTKLNQAQRVIELTMEIEKEEEIIFLDLKIIRKGGHFKLDIFKKSTQIQRTITYTSNHDYDHKMVACDFMIVTPLNEGRRKKETNYTLHTAKQNGHNQNIIVNRIQSKLCQASRQ